MTLAPPPAPSDSVCGPYLNRCTCRGRAITPRGPAEIQARHVASVARARRSGWGAWITPKRAEQPMRLAVDPTGREWAA